MIERVKGQQVVAEGLLLTSFHITTFKDNILLTNASGFFFQNNADLFAVTSRHVVLDEASGHQPDRLAIELHTDPSNMAQTTSYSIPLYHDGGAAWQQGLDAAGDVDVAVIEIDQSSLPETALYQAFSPEHLVDESDDVGIGSTLLIIGFPLGFHDTLHRMPVARHAIVASSFGLRFQGEGYFLTDGRTHRGSSGAPIVMRATGADAERKSLPWKLLGVHSARLDIGTRDSNVDEALGLNCGWYADILLSLTNP